MKLHKFIIPVVALATVCGSCYDEKMEWGTPDGHYGIDISEIPLSTSEQLAIYDYIKSYATQYMPTNLIGVGLTASYYIEDAEYKQVADDNFQILTTGNEMKHDAVVTSAGTLNFTTVDQFLNAAPADMKIYGHNFIWHTQQQQSYLRSLIAPVYVSASSSDVCDNVIENYDFETGTISGWNSWGNATQTITSPGYNSDYAMLITNSTNGASHEAQTAYDFNFYLEPDVTYVVQFYAKSSTSAGKLQVAYQNSSTYSSQGWPATFEVGTDWVLCNVEFTISYDDVNRILINSGEVAGDYYIDDFQFGVKIDNNPDAGRVNLIANGDFSSGIDNWLKWNGTDDATWNETEGNLSAGCLQIVNTYDTPSSQWNTQLYTALTETVPEGESVYISYYIRTLSGAGSVRCSTQGASHYQGDQTVSTSWQRIEWEISALNGDLTGICLDLGAVANTYLIDDVVVSTDPFTDSQSTLSTKAKTRAGSSYYQLKTAEEKKAALLEAMETWIQGMLEHVNTDSRFVGWDVINEPITDDGYFRGIDNHFGGTYEVDEVTYSDRTPVESEETGLTLNWGDGHFYWGYYLGLDYAVKAFEFARKYASPNIKLFVNDYNLETSPTKLSKLIEFVNYIEQNGQTVDGIGTQMHLTASSITRDEIDTMFKKLAGTGKLIRVTELDVALGTDAPDDDALQLQADVYQMVFESFKENVPEAQQSGITIWTLTDNAREHEYWLSGDVPNIFDASYGRKLAYKGVCDGIAGFDISTTFSGDDWVNAYDTEDDEEDDDEDADSSEDETAADDASSADETDTTESETE